MTISKSHIYANPYLVDEDLAFEDVDFKSQYPILSMDSCHLKAKFYKSKEDKIFAEMDIAATAILEDSYTCKPFKKKLTLSEDFEIMEDEDYEGEGFIVPGKVIDVSSLVVAIIRSSLPIRVLAPGSKIQSGGEGYSVRSESELVEEETSSPFDVLKDLDLED